MRHSIAARPRNSIIFILDDTIGEIPDIDGQGILWTTPSCIAVGTKQEDAGETRIEITTDVSSFEKDSAYQMVVSMLLSVPSRVLSILDSEDNLLDIDIAASIDVAVWVNDSSEPDHVAIKITNQNNV